MFTDRGDLGGDTDNNKIIGITMGESVHSCQRLGNASFVKEF